MYNSITQECTCKCGNKWQARTGKIPIKCPACGSRIWNSEIKTYTSIICRAGKEDEKTGYREFCFLEYIDQPLIVSSDLFYISKEDLNKFFSGRSPVGSGIILLGSFEVDETKLLKINEMKLVFCFEATYRTYMSTVSCLYNIKSFYQRQAALKKYNEDELLREQAEDRRKEETVQAGKARLESLKKKQLQTAEMERRLNDDSVSMEDRLQAVEFLGRA